MKEQSERKPEINLNFVPETLEWCKQHYVPKIDKYIACEDFGKCDGMNGSCWWCREMFPYQCEMCSDETWLQSLMNPFPSWKRKFDTKEEAIQWIEDYKQRVYKKLEDKDETKGKT